MVTVLGIIATAITIMAVFRLVAVMMVRSEKLVKPDVKIGAKFKTKHPGTAKKYGNKSPSMGSAHVQNPGQCNASVWQKSSCEEVDLAFSIKAIECRFGRTKAKPEC